MKKFASLLSVVAMTGATFAAGTAAAGAATPEAAPTAASSGTCPGKGTYVKARESVKIRKTKKLNGTAIGLFPKGAKAKFNGCFVSYGQTYHNLCTWDEDSRWSPIDYRGMKGWIPTACEISP
ncbi:hypothetical protein ACFWZ2_06430 [Streptomyces sp. NPDC059002]|uniref:hypothetical protein n=1 Tax=Streptomyces sp. NPDC059002 TaxID=3346690 RepID=UPI0036AA6A21